MNKQIGKINRKVIEILGLEYDKELPIMLGDTNIEHILKKSTNKTCKKTKSMLL